MSENNKNSYLVVISAPSGGGKTTLASELMSRFPNAQRSTSLTTRPARSTEIPGKDYKFINDEEFQKHIDKGSFAEWAEVHGFKYGTLKDSIENAIENKHILILTIDVQGAKSITEAFPGCLTFFVQPPDFDILESRLRKRGTESEEDIRRRLENARKEMSFAKDFKYTVLNDRLDRVALEIESIIKQNLA